MLGDYSVAFLAVAAISLLASPACAKLPKDAGDELSGHHEPATIATATTAVKTETADAGSVV
jgi:hypothetical protein